MREIRLENTIETVLFTIFSIFCYYFYWFDLILPGDIAAGEKGLGSQLPLLDDSILLLPIFLFLVKRKIYAYVLVLFFLVRKLCESYFIGFEIEICQKPIVFSYFWQMYLFILFCSIYLGFRILIKEHLAYKKLPLEEKKRNLKITEIIKRISYFLIPIVWYEIVTRIFGKFSLYFTDKWFNVPIPWK